MAQAVRVQVPPRAPLVRRKGAARVALQTGEVLAGGVDFLEAAESVAEEAGASRDYAAELNEEQCEAVTAPSGPALVLAGAGSGKTRTLTYRVAWLLDQGVEPGRILLLTFTNKAAREMLARVESLTGVPATAFWGGTFHHIGQRLLRRFGAPLGIEPGFTILDQGDAELLLQNTIRRLDADFLKAKDNPKAKTLANWISYARNTREPLEDIILERTMGNRDYVEPVCEFADAYREAKRRQQVADYDDLLELWRDLLEKDATFAEWCADRFQEVLVDEYQDTNRLQSEIVDRIATHHRVMAVGDDSQCIYTWRGAEFGNITTFPERHPGARIFKIETNYRSTPQILTFANQVLDAHSAGGFRKELRPVRPSREKPAFVTTGDGQQQAAFVMRAVDELRAQGRSLSDIAVLYRAHYQAMELQIELSRAGIPFLITSGVRFFEQAHIRDLTAHLRLVANPRDTSAFQRLACLLPKVGERTAAKLHQTARERAEAEERDFFDLLDDPAFVKKVPAVAREEWESLAITLRDCRKAHLEEESPEDITRLAAEGWYALYLRTLYTNWQNREDDILSVIGFAARFEKLDDLLTQLILLNSETSDRSIEDDEERMRLTTIHQAKGLEFPVVFVIGLADGLFPLNRAIESGDIDEEIRLFYVAVTRAQEELFLSFPNLQMQGGMPRKLPPTRFLSAIAPDHYRQLRYQPYASS